MPKGRVESFSDGVIAFAITLSRLICTVAWISHHEFMHDLKYVDPGLLWLNSLYLMWIAFPLPNRATWKSSGPTCGSRRLRVRLLRELHRRPEAFARARSYHRAWKHR
jgi:uncharacterized membrane protein